MKEINKRKEAIDLWLKEKCISKIGLKLSRSRQWVHKWINRHNTNPDNEWFKSFSRAPKTIHPRITVELEEQIINFRQKLCGQKYSQTGATSIHYEFYKAGMDPPPVWTINRILRCNNLIFNVIWRYFAWSNQTLATIVMWTITFYQVIQKKNYWITLLPALFMTAVITTYLLFAPEGFALSKDISYITGILITFLSLLGFIFYKRKSAHHNRSEINLKGQQ